MKLSPALRHRVFVAVGVFAAAFLATWQASHMSLDRDAIVSAIVAGVAAIVHYVATWAQSPTPAGPPPAK